MAAAAHLADGARGRVELPDARPAMDGDASREGRALGDGQRSEPLPERGIVHGHEGERTLGVEEVEAGGRALVAAHLLHLDQELVAEGRARHEDLRTRHHDAGERARPRRLLRPGGLPVPLLAGDAQGHDAGPRPVEGRRRGCQRHRRPGGGRAPGGEEEATGYGRARSHTARGSRHGPGPPSPFPAPPCPRSRTPGGGSGPCWNRMRSPRRRGSGCPGR